MDAKTVEILKKKRTNLRASVTKYCKKLETELEKTQVDINELEETLELLVEKIDTLSVTDNELEKSLDPSSFDKEYEIIEEYREKCTLWKFRAKKRINKEKNCLNTNTSQNIPVQNPENALTTENVKKHERIKLPKITIPKFYGDISQWLSFWNSFELSIHKNDSIEKVDKFIYLRSFLASTALNTVSGFAICSENYDSAIELLQSRFGNKDVLINAHIDQLLKINPLKHSNNIAYFRKLFDNIQTQIRSLESLNVDINSFSSLMSPLILKLLPQDLIFEFNKSVGKNSYNLTLLLEFLSDQLSAKEKSIIHSVQEIDRRQTDYVNRPSPRMKGDYEKSTNKYVKGKPFSAAQLIATDINQKQIKKTNCVFCDSYKHKSLNCDYAGNLSLNERKSILLKKGICFRCLCRRQHLAAQCDLDIICEECLRKGHNKLFCFNKCKQGGLDESMKEIKPEETTDLANQAISNDVYLQTLIVRISNKNSEHFIRLLIDSGSSKSYISTFAAEKLGLKSLGAQLVTHGLFGGTEKTEYHNKYIVNLSSLDKNNKIEVEVLDQKKICASIPKISSTHCMNELKEKGIILSDSSTKSKFCLHEKSTDEIHLLLGADIAARLYSNKIEHLTSGLIAVQTVLGWCTWGKVLNETKADSTLLALSLHVNEVKITDLWQLDTLGIKDPSEKQSNEEVQKLAMKHFVETVSRESDGRYNVCIPWLDGFHTISDNKSLSQKRLKNTVKNLVSTGNLKHYEQVFNEWEKEGVIEELTNENCKPTTQVHYLPHRAVIKQNSTTKIRPVFDGSACNKGSKSLNDCIEKGPNLIELIPAILNRFRLRKIGVTADIRRAFLQISINERDRNHFRFFWWKDGDPDNEVIYRHCRVVFGISCSPFLLGATLVHHLNQAPEKLQNVADKLKESLYVDNCVTSVDTVEELEYFRTESQKLLASAKFDLRGWCNNNPMISSNNRKEEKNMAQIENVFQDKVPLLGLSWDLEKDTLSCDLRNVESKIDFVSKRTILSIVHKIFDPIGFTCPTTIIPKMLLQECWKLKVSWDEKLPDEVTKEFEKWSKQISELKNLSVPRRLSTLSLSDGQLSLHTFCDASKTSYATCIFLRNESEDQVTCQLVQARSRVAPLKKITIPRLELLACCIGSRLTDSIKADLKLENVESYFWSDSMDALHWIKREGPWATFVDNRVREIRKLSPVESWRFVPGKNNPADLPSRGCSPASLIRSQWWLGPDWLLQPKNEWPKNDAFPNMEVVNSEKKKTIITTTNIDNDERKYYESYSSYLKLLRVTGWIFRFCNNSRKSKEERINGQLSNDEIKVAEHAILKHVQKEAFINEKDKRLKCFQIITDPEGIFRVKTKIFMREDDPNFRLPIILPSDHPVVKLLISWKHKQLGHCGVQLLMTELRENFWILKSRKTIKNIINKCNLCKKFRAQPPNLIESVLPEDRIRNASVFEIIGIDLAGPLFLKNEQKAWILILTCAVYRAIHLELLTSLSTDNFLLGLRRFIARRGRPSIIYSDHGTNFVGAHNLLKNVDWEKLKGDSNLSHITWKFIPPSAPWWGGFWERMVGLTKRILRKVLGKTSLNYEELVTVLCDCESLINSRPLTYLSEDNEDLSPITPNMFLQEIREVGVPDIDLLDHKKINKRLIYRNTIRRDLRIRFRKEYLSQLKQTKINGKDSLPIKCDDIVLIWADNPNRNNWIMGRILEVFPGKDGVIRIAKIKTKSGVVIRPVKKLYPLEIREEETPHMPDHLEQRTVTRAGRVIRQPHRYCC